VISSDGTPIAVWKSGHGAAILLVHGTVASHATTWRFILPDLESYFSVYSMDRRGRGGSGDSAGYGLEREAEDVAAVVNWIDGPVHVLGHSFGALYALESALLTPNIASLILYEGVPLRGAEGYAPGTIERLEEQLGSGDVEGMLIRMLREVAGIVEEEVEMLRSEPDAWKVRLGNAPTIPRELRVEQEYVFEPRRFNDMGTSTLLLVGQESMPRELANAQGVAEALARARIQLLPGQQHLAMYTAPDQFVRAVTEFVGSAQE
jgi:pimeloyl-ACP methyl ester carboxylesterase